MSKIATTSDGLRFNIVGDATSTFPLLQCKNCAAWLSFNQKQFDGHETLVCSCLWLAPQRFGRSLIAFTLSRQLAETVPHLADLRRAAAAMEG